MSDLTAQELRRRLDYDPETGVFTWLEQPNRRISVGTVAGSNKGRGYKQIKIMGRVYLMHRIAWIWMTGEWPKDQIDHKNTVRDDNRWSNLREATGTQNNGNSKPQDGGTSKFKGVHLRANGKWAAQIGRNYKNYHLGSFDTEKEAAAAYAKAADDYFGNFARVA